MNRTKLLSLLLLTQLLLVSCSSTYNPIEADEAMPQMMDDISVGAEMPSHWNPEALKAQAVAARSYTLVHLVRPADSDFNLGDTTRWQAYGGINTQS